MALLESDTTERPDPWVLQSLDQGQPLEGWHLRSLEIRSQPHRYWWRKPYAHLEGCVCRSYMGGALKGQISLQLKKHSTPVHHMWIQLLMVCPPLHHFWGQVAQHPGLPK